MANNEYDQWRTRFEEGQSSMIAGLRDAACCAYRDALQIAESGCVSSAELAETLEGLAVNRRWVEKDADVVELFDRAESSRQHVLNEAVAKFGDAHLNTAEAYYKLAFHNSIRGRALIAISYFEKTLSIKRLIYGKQHFEVANTLMIMGGTHPDVTEQVKLWEQAVSVLEHLISNPDECDASSAKHVPRALRGGLENLACQAFFEGRVTEAEEYFRRAMATCSITNTNKSCSLCNIAVFGKVLLAQQKYDECEAILINAVSSTNGFIKRTCSEVLADLYDQTDRPSEARELRGCD